MVRLDAFQIVALHFGCGRWGHRPRQTALVSPHPQGTIWNASVRFYLIRRKIRIRFVLFSQKYFPAKAIFRAYKRLPGIFLQKHNVLIINKLNST